jgi:hypothetical protein
MTREVLLCKESLYSLSSLLYEREFMYTVVNANFQLVYLYLWWSQYGRMEYGKTDLYSSKAYSKST